MRTRFVPAPTGHLHLGHVLNAEYVWGAARLFGGEVLLRIEDHDRERSRLEFETAILDDLDWIMSYLTVTRLTIVSARKPGSPPVGAAR